MLDVRMAATSIMQQRKPLAPVKPSPASQTSSLLKRPRSPEPTTRATKRVKSERAIPKLTRDERERQKEDFRVKYTQAFPSWSFYFDDVDPLARDTLGPRVVAYGATIESSFTDTVTHVITNQQVSEHKDRDKDKENACAATSLLDSPIKLRVRSDENLTLVAKAKQQDKKIWSTEKLASVLDRLLPSEATRQRHTSTKSAAARYATNSPYAASHNALSNHKQHNPISGLKPKASQSLFRAAAITKNPSQALGYLLEVERQRGTTIESDPTARRNDYKYFSRGCCYVLIEDIQEELATIAAYEYPKQHAPSRLSNKEKQPETPWPTLYADPRAYSPFSRYDERAEKRRQIREADARVYDEQLEQRKRELARRKEMQGLSSLRRTNSESDLRRQLLRSRSQATLDVDTTPAASGYACSGEDGAYWAASGNSVTLTSNVASTTSHANLLNGVVLDGNQVQFSRSLTQIMRLEKELPAFANVKEPVRNQECAEGDKENIPVKKQDIDRVKMPPPNANARVLKKSKSTNSLKMRLHGREEAKRSGYCENCRCKFEDIKQHQRTRKHLAFARDAQNFLDLDVILAKVARRPAK